MDLLPVCVALRTCTVEFLPAVFVRKFPFGPCKTFLALRKVLHLDQNFIEGSLLTLFVIRADLSTVLQMSLL